MRERLQEFLNIYQDPQYTDDYIKEMLDGWANANFTGFPYSPDTFHATYELGFLNDNQICEVYPPNNTRYLLKSVKNVLTDCADFSYAIVFEED